MRALILSGGGYRGVFEAGYLIARNWNFDVVFGTSVGALNGMMVAQDKRNHLGDIWASVIHDGLRFHRKPKWYEYITFLNRFGRLGYYTNNIKDIVKQHIGTFTRPYICTVSDLIYGKLWYVAIANSGSDYACEWRNPNSSVVVKRIADAEEVANIITASTSIPGMFPPIKLHDMYLVDGGVRDITPLSEAIRVGADHLTIVNCSPSYIDKEAAPKNVVDVVTRSIGILTHEIDRNDVGMAKLCNKLAEEEFEIDGKHYRHVDIEIVRPDKNYIQDSLNPTREQLLEAYGYGVDKACQQ